MEPKVTPALGRSGRIRSARRETGFYGRGLPPDRLSDANGLDHGILRLLMDNPAVTAGNLADAVSACQRSGAIGWDLINKATQLVYGRFATYSLLHVWERPEVAFERGRAYCTQYNGALAQILGRLGFDTQLVCSPPRSVRRWHRMDPRPHR